MDLERFDEHRKLDPNELDLAAATQAELFFEWAQKSAEARAQYDRRKLRLELVEARVMMDARKNPDKFGLGRVTEGGLTAAVKLDREVRRATRKMLEAKEEMMLLDAAVQAMEQRKRMIEVLITLHGQQYFAGPSVPKDLVSAWKDYQEKKAGGVVEAQRARARKVGGTRDE